MTRQPIVEVDGDTVLIYATKCLYAVGVGELIRMLIADPVAYVQAVRRGKSWRRGQATAARAARS